MSRMIKRSDMYEMEPITDDNRRPGMDPAHTYLVRYDRSEVFGWRCCRTFATSHEAEAFVDGLMPDEPAQPEQPPPGHTPGPWRAVGEEVETDTGIFIAEVLRWGPGIPYNKESEANARLIAAAPDLLDAANALAMSLCGYAHQNAITKRALAKWRDAFTKATGKTV